MAQCKPQERILSSALVLATGRLYRLRGNIEMAQTYERRGEKILWLMVTESSHNREVLHDSVDQMLSAWETTYADNPLYIDEWVIALRECIDRDIVDIWKYSVNNSMR